MAKLPKVIRDGFARPTPKETIDEDDIDEKNIDDEFIETYEYDNEKYDLIYKSMNPNTNKMVIVKPEIAKEAIKEFIQNEIGHYMDDEFQIINGNIETKFNNLKDNLKDHIKNKVDLIAEDIATEMVSSHFKEAVQKKVEKKLEKLKGLLDDEE
ncbi:MAG: hypothetical protein ACOCP8_03480 [archaeon]